MSKMVAVSMAVLLMLGVVAGCDSKPTHESLLEEMAEKLTETATVLEGVTDEASANAAKPKLQAINTRLKELQAEESKLPKPSADEEKRLKDKFEPKLEEATKKLFTQATRLATDPKLAAVLNDAMPGGPAGGGALPGL